MASWDSIVFFGLGYNFLLRKHSGLNQRAYLGMYACPIKITKGNINYKQRTIETRVWESNEYFLKLTLMMPNVTESNLCTHVGGWEHGIEGYYLVYTNRLSEWICVNVNVTPCCYWGV